MSSLLNYLIWFILFFVCVIIFAPYLSIFAYWIWFLAGAFRLVFDMFAFTGASCSSISWVAGIVATFLLWFLFIKIYKIFRSYNNN